MIDLHWMLAPAVACLLVALALGWFGLHVLQRGVIFVDLALAQVAALGTTVAVFLGHEPDAPAAYALAVVFTAIGALAFAAVRRFEEHVPAESLIGISYVVSAASAAVLMDFAADPHGAEKLQHLLVGNVVWVRWSEIALMAAVIAGVGLFHLLARGPLLQISFDPEGAEAAGTRIALWDLLFYLSFGLVITTLVHVVGVLLIFSYLIIPAVIARLLAHSVRGRLAVAYGVAIPVSMLGIGSSYEHAAGPIIVVLLGASLLLALAIVVVRHSARPGAAALGVVGVVTVLAVAMGLASQVPTAHAEHVHTEHAHADHAAPQSDLPTGLPATEREAWYRQHLERPELLRRAAQQESDPSLQLLLGTALAQQGEVAGLRLLAKVANGELPFLRMEADDRLHQLAGDGVGATEPLDGPVALWTSWAAAPSAGWGARARTLTLP